MGNTSVYTVKEELKILMSSIQRRMLLFATFATTVQGKTDYSTTSTQN